MTVTDEALKMQKELADGLLAQVEDAKKLWAAANGVYLDLYCQRMGERWGTEEGRIVNILKGSYASSRAVIAEVRTSKSYDLEARPFLTARVFNNEGLLGKRMTNLYDDDYEVTDDTYHICDMQACKDHLATGKRTITCGKCVRE